MRQEHLLERQAKLIELSERACDLWGRILDAQIEYLNEHSPVLHPQRGQLLKPIFEWNIDGLIEYAEGQPPEMDLNEKNVNFEGKSEEVHKTYNEYSGQASMAQYLSNMAFEKAEKLPDANKLKPKPTPEPRKKPAAPKLVKTFSATTRSREEMADYTTSVTEKTTSDLDDIHEAYKIGKSEESNKRQFAGGETVLHVNTGGESIEQRVRNRFIIVQEDFSQVVLWLAQAGGPRHAPFLQLPTDRVRFALTKINLGKDAGKHMDRQTIWDHIEKAAEQGLLTDVEDPKITPEGLEHIKEKLEQQDHAIEKDRRLAFV